MCDANSYIEGSIILAEIDPNGYFWLSEGSGQSRYYKKSGTSNRAYPQESCVSCPTPTPTPPPTNTPVPTNTPTPTPTPDPSSCECLAVYNESGSKSIIFQYVRCIDGNPSSLTVAIGDVRTVCVEASTNITSDDIALLTVVSCATPCTANSDCSGCV